MNDNVVFMADVKDDAGLWSIPDMLESAKKEFKAGKIKANKAIVVFLDDTESSYNVTHYQVDMRRSEIVSLMEFVKATMISQLQREDL